MQIPTPQTPRGDVMYSWQGVRGILESLEDEVERDTPETPRSTRSRRSRRRGWSAEPGMGDWSVDSIEEGIEDGEEEGEGGGRRREHRRTDTDVTIRPAISRDVFRDQGQSSTGVLSSSPEADPSSNIAAGTDHLTPVSFAKPQARIRKQVSLLIYLCYSSLIVRRHVLASNTTAIALPITPHRSSRPITDDPFGRTYAPPESTSTAESLHRRRRSSITSSNTSRATKTTTLDDRTFLLHHVANTNAQADPQMLYRISHCITLHLRSRSLGVAIDVARD